MLNKEVRGATLVSVPVYNGGELWKKAAAALNAQFCGDVLVIDSSSKDDSLVVAKQYGFHTLVIDSLDFNHGGTRNIAIQYALKNDYEFIVFLTQDSIVQQSALDNIASYFEDPKVVAVCGRQSPHDDANPVAAHARYFNYSDKTLIKSMKTIPKYGIKSAFMSNSFSAYRLSSLLEVGMFPENTILCEDMFVSGKFIQSGYKNVYASDAVCKHSHNYTPIDEFKRYFDIGVFHEMEPWIRNEFGGARGEGFRFIISEFKYLLKHAPLYIPLALLNNFAKILGMKLGGEYKLLPLWLNKKLSMHKSFWK
ncbi:glycosyltransferase [Vibrio fortis]|uniref:glycosyltransferase n=1 Tax=Vibrio fortis TaxID=212667 RepID=UPI0021C3A354|nr:glycosyltransferase [Vibrio fortis]